MFGAVTKYMFTDLLGIKLSGAGCRDISIDNKRCIGAGVSAEGSLKLFDGRRISAKI